MTTWSNWARSVTASGIEVAAPGDAEGVADVLRAASGAGRRVRPLGSGHSFSPLAQPVDIALDLRALRGVRGVDAAGRVRVGAGTTIAELNAALASLGLAMPNLGDIDRQTIAGALATGTHGTGGRLRGIASDVVGVQLVVPEGTVLDLAPGDPLFDAARINLGALGAVTEVTVAAVPAFRLRAEEGPMPLAELLADVEGFVGSADHAEFFWFPHTSVASTRRNHRIAEPPSPAELVEARPLSPWRALVDDRLLGNGAFEVINRVGRRLPRAAPALNRLSAAALGRRTYADASHKVFCSVRDVRFVESEYAVPRDAVVDVVRDLRAWFDRTRHPVTFPLEVRFLAADDVWLSGAHGRDVAYVACHQYWRSDPRELFAAFEAVVGAYGGRPHWGKQHSLGVGELLDLHPRLGEFIAVRNRLDPGRVLTNPHLDRVLGP